MRFLSLFSGIEAASVALLPLGAVCVGVAEIEPFPCSVLKHHYPDVPNLGDITKITEEQIKSLGHIDVVIAGFPCTDLSIAGKRKGLKNEDGSNTRSGLFFIAMRIVRWSNARFLWLENVPGIYSSNAGRDFAAVAGEILRCEFDVPKNGWENSGAAASEIGLLEWATLDAQYAGLAQRRNRMFAVADFGDWANRPPILLESFGLSGDSPTRKESRQEITSTLGARTSSGGGFGADFECDGGLQPVAFGGSNQSGSIDIATARNACASASASASGRMDFETETFLVQKNILPESSLTGTLNANGKAAGSATQQDAESGMLVPTILSVALRGREGGATAELGDEVAGCLRASSGGGDKAHVLAPIAFQPGNLIRGCGSAPNGEVFPTLSANHGRGKSDQDPHVMYPIAFSCKDYGGDACIDLAPTLRSGNADTSHANGGQPPAIAFDSRQDCISSTEVFGSLGSSSPQAQAVAMRHAIRRLTVVECERLQGFQDNYTFIPTWNGWRKMDSSETPESCIVEGLEIKQNKKTGKWRVKDVDGPRYRALGNSMAVPVIAYIGKRIMECMP